jgi:hypothetical protein
MALSKEDHHDVKSALGKAMANKISKVTRDSVQNREDKAEAGMLSRMKAKSKGVKMSRSILG